MRLVRKSSAANLFFQSPEYFDNLVICHSKEELYLAVFTGHEQKLEGIAPLRRMESSFSFEAKGLSLFRPSLASLRLLGTDLLAVDMYEVLFQHLNAGFHDYDCIEIGRLQTDSPLFEYLQTSQNLKQHFLLYSMDGPRKCHIIKVPAFYEDYLAIFSRKRRYNLARIVRLMQEWSGGRLELSRIRAEADLALLYKAFYLLGMDVSQITEKTMLVGLAQSGLLLSYVLHIDGRPYAAAFGTIYMDCLSIHEIKHDGHHEQFSPGTVLHMLMMQDLITDKTVKLIDYGFGEPKIRLSTHQVERIKVFLFRKTLRNKLMVAAHSVFQRFIMKCKGLL